MMWSLSHVWPSVENGDVFEGPDHHEITPDQMAEAVWNSLIHEARGVAYFNGCISSNNFRYPIHYGPTCYVAIRARAKRGECADPRTGAGTEHAILSMEVQPQPRHNAQGAGRRLLHFRHAVGDQGRQRYRSRTLQLPPGLTGSAVEVLFESCTLPTTLSGNSPTQTLQSIAITSIAFDHEELRSVRSVLPGGIVTNSVRRRSAFFGQEVYRRTKGEEFEAMEG